MNQSSSAASAEWKAYWPVVMSAMLGMSFYATVNYSFDQFAAPVEQELGFTRAQVFWGLFIFNMLPVPGGPLVGALIDRYGPRRIALPGLALSILGFTALSQASGSFIQWLGLWLMFGLCALLIKSTVWTVAISRVFSTSRGFALSVMLCGTAVAEAVAKLYPNWLVIHHGWRFAYMALAFSWGGLALILIVLFFRETPIFRETHAKGGPALPQHASTLPGLGTIEAFRSRPILRVGFANLICALVGGGVGMHLSLVLKDAGLDRGTAAMVAATAGVAGIAGKLITGWLCDRTRSSWLPFSSFALAALGYGLLLNHLQSTAALVLGVMILGYAGGASFQVTAYLTGRYGGLKNFGKIYGTMGSMIMLGAAIGPVVSGRIHDMFGSYQPLIWAGIPVVLIAALMTVGLGPYPDFNSPPEPETSPEQAPAT
jgi:MFS family permease